MKISTTAILTVLGVTFAQAEPPRPITSEELGALRADAATAAPKVEAGAAEVRKSLAAQIADSATATAATAAFLVVAGQPPTANPPPPEVVPGEPLKQGPGDTLITCDGGMYVDPDAGVMVYLKNVVVKDPKFTLTGANELKVFLEKKAPEPAKPGDGKPGEAKPAEANPPKPAAPGDPNAKPEAKPAPVLGDPERIIATGAIIVEKKGENGGNDIKASAALFSYNIKDDEIILSGGFPWFIQGQQALRAKAADQSVRISPKTGALRTDSGAWETLLSTPEKKAN